MFYEEVSAENERKTRAQILESALPIYLRFGPGVWRRAAAVQSDHLFEAVICADTGDLWARDAWDGAAFTEVGPLAGGWIWTPPAPAPVSAEPPLVATADG